MMFKEYIIEALLLICLVVFAIGLFNPYYMPMGLVYVGMCVLVVLFAAFVVLMWREKGDDEREEQIIHKADRIGFLLGSGALIVAIVYNTVVVHQVSDWILGALFVMILGKVISTIYLRLK